MDRLVLISLLVKLGVAAAVASTLARSREFQSLLYREERTLKQKIYLTIWIAIPFALGIVVRVVTPKFIAADLSFEAVMLIGVIGGRFAGALGGILIAVPAAIHGELLSLPLNVLCGLIAGTLRDAATEREMIWSFSPFVDLSLYRWVRKVLPRPKIDWQISFFLVIIGLEFLRMELARSRWFHSYIFAVDSSNTLDQYCDLRDGADVHRHPAEDLEQHTYRAEAGTAGAAPDAGAHGGAAEPD